MKGSQILVFLLTYALFCISGIFFQLDPVWYNPLAKPSWTPPGSVIGIVWATLFALISLAITILYSKVGWRNLSVEWKITLVANYLTNQAFSYFLFIQKDLLLAFLDCALVAVTSLILVLLTRRYSPLAARLLIPYLLWTTFATYLSWEIYRLNLG